MKIVFILPGLGGMRLIPQMFATPPRHDSAYFIVNGSALSGAAEGLAEFLREELNLPVFQPAGDIEIAPGSLYVLAPGPQVHVFKDAKHLRMLLKPEGADPLDLVLESASRACKDLRVAVLSGILLDGEGMKGLEALAARGVPMAGPPPEQSLIYDAVESLREKGLVRHIFPLRTLLPQLEALAPGS